MATEPGTTVVISIQVEGRSGTIYTFDSTAHGRDHEQVERDLASAKVIWVKARPKGE